MEMFDRLFLPLPDLDFKELDLPIDPDHFHAWLSHEDNDINGEYFHDVGNMCEYSCLYLAMLLHETEVGKRMRIRYGNFGFFEHYWVVLEDKGKEYFIDLTLKQFISDAPKLAISDAQEPQDNGYRWDADYDDLTFKEYIDTKDAFVWYTWPDDVSKDDLAYHLNEE